VNEQARTDPGRSADDIQPPPDGSVPPLACGATSMIAGAGCPRAGRELTDHQRGCRHRQAARREFSSVRKPARGLAAEKVSPLQPYTHRGIQAYPQN
jgi:hypothetical protein